MTTAPENRLHTTQNVCSTSRITNTSLKGHVDHAKEFAEYKFFGIRQASPAVCKYFIETLSTAVQSVEPASYSEGAYFKSRPTDRVS
jgi:hypothetical protein